MKIRILSGLILILMAFFITSCTEKTTADTDPKRRLADYISKSFSVKAIDDKSQLLEFMTGGAKTRLASWSEDQFRQAFLESKRQFIKLVFKEEKTPNPTQSLLTYEISYLDQNKTAEAKVTNKKIATLINENGQWYISDVKNIKELIEYKDDVSLP